ncbi:MAG: Sensor histidine kinase ResE [Myxococcota bacterium]|nr:Sensor histidine kinase ResE [Myxococcota bacterium]
MKLGARGKLFFMSLALTSGVMLVSGFFLRMRLHDWHFNGGRPHSPAELLELDLILAAFGGVVLATAIIVSAVASWLLSRNLRKVVEYAQTIIRGERPNQLLIDSTDELRGLAGSFNRLASDLEEAVGALADERNRLEAVLESLEEGVLAVDSQRRITMANRAAQTMLGIARADRQFVEDVARSPALNELAQAGSRGEVVQDEFELQGRTTRRLLGQVNPLRSGGAVIVLRDVTDLRRLENLRKDFVANVSHELRTPVSIMQANAENLLDGALNDPPAARNFVEAMLRNAERLSRLISDLLDISRMESGQMTLDLQPINIRQVASHVTGMVEGKSAEKNIRVESHIAPDLAAQADARALDQVVFNLVDNAIKYTPAGGLVEIAAAPEGGGVRIEVRDDGPGVEPRHRERLFERFYRVDPGRSREMGGTGLGLAIVKHLAEAMGGDVGMEPNHPKGSVFWIRLPAAEHNPSSLGRGGGVAISRQVH